MHCSLVAIPFTALRCQPITGLLVLLVSGTQAAFKTSLKQLQHFLSRLSVLLACIASDAERPLCGAKTIELLKWIGLENLKEVN